jgi:hypothetical protein
VDEPYAVNDKEFESVVGLEAGRRYDHFIKRVADTQRVYVLEHDGSLVSLTDESGDEPDQLPLWPHPRYGEAYRDQFGGAPLAELGLAKLVDDVLPGLAEDGINVAVFPTPDGRGPVVPAQRLLQDLLAYHAEWYGGRPES